jgi:AcrR family transcriptional regulator
MAPSGEPGARTRGRPVEIDPARLSRTAVELFAKRGYDDVSAAEVADAAGVSRRSLFRYFPTKADLVWYGFEGVLEVLSVALLQNGDEPPVQAVVDALMVAAQRTPALELARARLQILADHAELVSMGLGRLDEMIQVCAAYLRDRGVDDLTAQVQATALVAASFTGYLHWATQTSDPTPVESVRRALDAVSAL